MLLPTSGVRMPIRRCQSVGHARPRAPASRTAPCAQLGQRADGRCCARSTSSGKTPSRCRSPATRARAAPCDAGRPLPRASKTASRAARLAMAREAGEADDLACMGDEVGAGAGEPGARRPDLGRIAHGAARGADLAGSRSMPPMATTSRSRVELASRPVGDDASITHHHDAVGVAEDLAQHVRDHDAAQARSDEAADDRPGAGSARCASSEEVGSSRMTSLGGASVIGEGARDLDHLPLGRSAGRRRWSSGVDAVAGKDGVELLADQARGAAPPAQADQPGCTSRVFSAHGQVRAEREFLEHAAHARRRGPRPTAVAGVASAPSIRIVPASAASVPASTCISVDLPAPL